MKKIIICLSLVISISCWSAFASYQVELTPSVSLDTQYDDNIYLENANEESDWITSFSPGIFLNIYSQKNSFSLNYSSSIVRYKERDDNDTVRHSASIIFNQSLSQNLEFMISDTYLKSEEPLETTENIIGVRRTRYPYQRNNGDVSMRYSFGPSNLFEIGYSHSLLENEDITINDGIEENPYANYLYWFNSKHGLELNAGYTKADFSRDDNLPPEDDYSGLTQGIGYRYRYNPNSTLFIHYDYTDRNFKGSAIDYKVYEGVLGLEKKISQDLSYNVSAGYFIRKNDLDENDNGFNADISLTKTINRGSFNFSGSSGWDEAYLEAENRGFTKYQSITSSFNYQVTENLSNNISVSYRQDKDETEISRKSKTLSTWYGWSWAFLKDYSMSLDYTCTVRDDDIDTDDYLVNQVMFSLKWSMPYR
jgi:hypothetical protein